MPERPPITRPSLILRLRNNQDADAWSEFVTIYEPVVYRLALRMGMQPADAVEATQEVLCRVATVIDRWEPGPSRGTFRGWLYRVSRNVMIRFMETQKAPAQGSGNTDIHMLLNQHPDPSSAMTRTFDAEYCRQVFAWAAARVRPKFQPATWDAFWQTTVEHRSIPDVADCLSLSRGAVYVARSRVMNQLRKEVQRFLEELPDLSVDSRNPSAATPESQP